MPEVTDDPSSTWIPQPLAALAPDHGTQPDGPHLWDVSAARKADAHRHLHRFSCPANEPVPGWRRVAGAHDGANGKQWAAARIGRDAGPVGTLRWRPGAVAQMEHTRRGGRDDVPAPTTGLLRCYCCCSIRSVIRGSG